MMMDSNGTTTTKDMEKIQDQQQQQQQQQQLKCPRCDSSNTKFCYYNNYSLSQPRHFCKACKRYWTRGGTLRNVPVGGGCRKNKRIKRPSSTNSSTNDHHIVTTSSTPNISLATTTTTSTNPSSTQHLNIHGGGHNINPLFYGLTSGSSDLNNPFARLFSSRVSGSADEGQLYLDSLGLGFSSSGALMGENNYGHGYIKQIQDVNGISNSTNSSSFLSSYPMFGSSSSTCSSSTSTMASLIASSLQQQKIISNMSNNFQSLAPYEELQMSRNNNSDNVEGGNGMNMMLKEEKLEGGDGQNRLNNWNHNNLSSNHQSHQIHEQIISSNDPSISWNGAWFDPSNMGSNSVPSLI